MGLHLGLCCSWAASERIQEGEAIVYEDNSGARQATTIYFMYVQQTKFVPFVLINLLIAKPRTRDVSEHYVPFFIFKAC